MQVAYERAAMPKAVKTAAAAVAKATRAAKAAGQCFCLCLCDIDVCVFNKLGTPHSPALLW